MNVLPIAALLPLALASSASFADPPASSSAVPAPAVGGPTHCLKDTGTRITPKDGHCVNAPGQVISHEDIERSGATNAAEALRDLSPSVQLQRR